MGILTTCPPCSFPVDGNHDRGYVGDMNNTDALSTVELATAYSAMSAKLKAANDAGRSVSTLNRLWAKYFRLEDALKGRGGF